MARTTVHSKGNVRSRMMAVMSYMGILCFVPLFRNTDDEYVYFHAKQGLVIWMWGVIAIFALHLPGVGKWLFSFSAMAVVALSLIGVASVLLNRAWKLPFVYSVSRWI